MNHNRTTPARIVVGIDGRNAGWRALDWAIRETRTHGVPLLAVHCLKTAPEAGLHFSSTVREPPSQPVALTEAEQRIRAQAPSMPISAHALVGDPSTALHDTVNPSDLLVLGLRRRSRLTARVLGSTTSRSLTHPPCTVAVIPAPNDQSTAEGPFPEHVVAAIKGANSAKYVLPWAFTEAQAHHRPLAAVHAESPTEGPTGAVVDDRMLEAWPSPLPASLGMLEDSLGPWHTQYPDLTTRRAYFHGSPSAVLDYVCHQAFALVLAGPGQHRRAVHLANTVLARASCPIMVGTASTTSTVS